MDQSKADLAVKYAVYTGELADRAIVTGEACDDAKQRRCVMTGETITTLVGNLTADPELRFTPAGVAVANFTVASTPRVYDRESGEWKDGDTLFLRCNVWRQTAENVAQSFVKGARVIVQGRLKQRSFETREGGERTVVELEVDAIGPELRYASAKISKTARVGDSATGGEDPWQSPPAVDSDEVPF